MGTLSSRWSFSLLAGTGSQKLLPTILLWRVHCDTVYRALVGRDQGWYISITVGGWVILQKPVILHLK